MTNGRVGVGLSLDNWGVTRSAFHSSSLLRQFYERWEITMRGQGAVTGVVDPIIKPIRILARGTR